MAKLQQWVLRNDLLTAAKRLPQIRSQYGRDCEDYQGTLTHVARLWAVLRMTRVDEEFFHAVE